MPRRWNNLFERVVAFPNLLDAARKARQGCGRTDEACRFHFHLESEICRLEQELRDGSYRPGPYRQFKVHDPKERTITVAPFRDRVVHHAVVQILTPLYERKFIHDSYATRPEKGTHKAILRAREFCRRYEWYLKADILHFFENVCHDIMMASLERSIKDRRLLDLMNVIVRSMSPGLPIGNLTSQFLANVYLDRLDHAIKDDWGIKGYVRYMDDFVLFGTERDSLSLLEGRIDELLRRDFRLELKPSASCLNRTAHGLGFLGMRIHAGCIRVRPENARRVEKRMRGRWAAWRDGRLDEGRLADSLAGSMEHLRHFQPGRRLNFREA